MPTFIVIEDQLCSDESVAEMNYFTKVDLIGARMVILKEIFICVYNLMPSNTRLQKEILAELFTVDNSQLADRDLKSITAEHIRLVCNLEEEEITPTEKSEEEQEAEMRKLLKVYKKNQFIRYRQRMEF